MHHKYELHLPYPSVVHFKWMVNLVAFQIKFLVLGREDLTNQVEGGPLRNTTTIEV